MYSFIVIVYHMYTRIHVYQYVPMYLMYVHYCITYTV